MLRALGVIPARFESTRFRGKPLAPLNDLPLVEHVWRGAVAAHRLDRVVIATDDDRIASVCRAFGAEVAMTSPGHHSGTDRVAEVARSLDGFEVVVNVQGDEPLVTGTSLDRLVEAFDADPRPDMATLVEPARSAEDLFDPNVVKVVAAGDGRALYFSRSPIPYHRAPGALHADFRGALENRPGGVRGWLRHQGIYAYTRDALLALTALPPSPLEVEEGLEQLRALEAGLTIRVVASDFASVGVDTPADLETAASLLARPRPTVPSDPTEGTDR